VAARERARGGGGGALRPRAGGRFSGGARVFPRPGPVALDVGDLAAGQDHGDRQA